jgi:uncharacterized protein YjaG (DUF416 family)
MRSIVYGRYIADAASWAKAVDFWRAALYCYVMCQRLEPAYVMFHQREKWGNPQLLKDAQHFVHSWLVSDELDDLSARTLLAAIESIIPDTEQFADCSDALDAVRPSWSAR